mmetsp:Transcript_9505/g.25527  ORF Transcript_9505/g.25527 Transcript_9505/m.25527 type:complete len:274 (+) Transcript_9505:772-1593(+)
MSGRPTSNCLGRRRSTASSTSYGLLVAASTVTCAISSVLKPSHRLRNSVFIVVTASCSWLLRVPRKASISSMKIMHGCSFQASVNTAVTSFCASPNHLLCSWLILTLMKNAPDSLAIALASIVFPVPGGPYSRHPLTGESRLDRLNRSGRVSGRMIFSYSASLMEPSPPILSKVTLIWCGLTTSHAMTSSYWSVSIARPSLCCISFLRAICCLDLCRDGSSRLSMKTMDHMVKSEVTPRKTRSCRNLEFFICFMDSGDMLSARASGLPLSAMG